MSLKIGFSTNVFDNPADILESVRKAAADFKHVELELSDAAERTVYDASPEEYLDLTKKLKEFIFENEISLTIHAPYIGLTGNLAAIDENRRLQSVERLKKSILFAHDVGAKVVTCHPGLRLKQSNQTLIPILYKSLSELVPFAEKLGVQLSVENMGNERPNYIVLSVDEQIEMCKQTGVSITLDLIHLVSMNGLSENLYRDLSRLAPYMRNLHIADMTVPSHVHIPIGEGDLPVDKCLSELFKNGYKGPAIVEEFGGPFDTEMFYRNARAFKYCYENIGINI